MLNRKEAEVNLRFYGYRYKGRKYGIDSEYIKGLKRFQDSYKKKYGLKVSGKYDSKTDEALAAEIKRVQEMLYFLGYDVKVNGKFNKNDRNAVRKIQKKHCPKEYKKYDGIIDGKTWDRIKYYYKKKHSKSRYFFQFMNGSLNWSAVEREHFKKDEFKCKCGGKYCNGYPEKIDPKIIYTAIKLRRKYGQVTITSGLRCKKWNSLQSGSSSVSTHMKGKAIDFYIKVVTDSKAGREKVKKYLNTLPHTKYTYSDTPNMGSAVHVNV